MKDKNGKVSNEAIGTESEEIDGGVFNIVSAVTGNSAKLQKDNILSRVSAGLK